MSYEWKQQPSVKAMSVPQIWQRKDISTPCFSVAVEELVRFNLLSDLDKMRFYVKTLEEGLYWLW